MKKFYFVLAILALGLTACNTNEIDTIETPEAVGVSSEAPVCFFNLSASFGGDAATKVVTIGENIATSTFAETDNVYVVIEHDGVYAIAYDPAERKCVSMTVTPGANSKTATLSGAMKFYYDDGDKNPIALTPAEGDAVYLFYNMIRPNLNSAYLYFDYLNQTGSKDQKVTSYWGDYYYGASYHDYGETKMKIAVLEGDDSEGYTMSLVQYDNPDESDVTFENVGSLFRQELSFTDKNGDPVTPTLSSFVISMEDNKTIKEYYPLARDTDLRYSRDPLTMEPLDLSDDGNIYFAMMFVDDNRNETLYFTAEDEDGNVYTASKAAPAGGFENGKYYYGSMSLTWQKCMVDLSQLNDNYVAQDGDWLFGTLAGDYKISVADGATVTLSGITINGGNDWDTNWAGITCEGDATLVLADGTENLVRPFCEIKAAISVPAGKTLTIQGSGSLTADALSVNSNGAAIGGNAACNAGNIVITGAVNVTAVSRNGAGIGTGLTEAGSHISCGDITINTTGTVTATGGDRAAGIGAAEAVNSTRNDCGNILISRGTIVATGGNNAAGIGTGRSADINGSKCGNITIEDTVTSVTATQGLYADVDSIGMSSGGLCAGTITIGGTIYWGPKDSDPTKYEYKNGGNTYLGTSPLIYEP